MAKLTRRAFVQGSVATVAAVALGGCRSLGLREGLPRPSPSDPLTTYDPHLYLFVDDHWIERRDELERVVNEPRPLPEPVVWPEDPRTQSDAAWGNVIREKDGLFRMWYCTLMLGAAGGGHHEMAKAGVWGRGAEYGFHPRSSADVPETDAALGKYAESTDGIHWTKPELGLYELHGSKRNNIILNGERARRQTDGALTNFDGCTVIRDDAEPDPMRRYKMISHWESIHCHDNKDVSGFLGRPEEDLERFRAARGKYLTYSPDGVLWDQPFEKIRFPDGGGDRFLVVRDHRNERWFGYSRVASHQAAAFSYSTNLRDWSAPEVETVITPAAVQAPKVECLVPFNYGNQDLGVPVGMDKDRSMAKGARAMIPFLSSHHDGGSWRLVGDGKPFISPGPPGSYYATGAVPLHNEPFILGDQMIFYFNAFSRYQETRCPFGDRSIGVARLRRDGFVGLEHCPTHPPGVLQTRPVRAAGNELQLNVAPAAGRGSVEVALEDAEGHAIAGFGFEDSVPLQTDGVRVPVRWKHGGSIERLRGQQVRVALRLRGPVTVYALRWA